MDKKTLYTLKLKLDKHQINFDFDESKSELSFGKSYNLTSKWITGILIIIACFFVAGLPSRLNLPMAQLMKIIFILLSSIGFGIIANAIRKGKNNKYVKKFSKDSLKLVSKKDITEFTNDDISEIDYLIKKNRDNFTGTIEVKTKNKGKYQILTITEKEQKYLKNDLEYIVEIIKNLLQIEQ